MDDLAIVKTLISAGRQPDLRLRCPRKEHPVISVWEMPSGARLAAVNDGGLSALPLRPGAVIRCYCKCQRPGVAWYEVESDWLISTGATSVKLAGSGSEGRWRFVKPDTPTD